MQYAVVGVGLGQDERIVAFFRDLLQRYRKSMVVNADALNILAAHPDWLGEFPPTLAQPGTGFVSHCFK